VTARIPVTLLTGFLGSGKTTLLSGLIRRPELADTAVVVNEFGEIGLDHVLLERGREDVVLLESGCLCCAVSSELGETLADLHFRRRRGELPDFRRLVIETSGLADPGPILSLLLGDPDVTRWYAFDKVVTCVDALHGDTQLALHPEAMRQAAVADTLVVTKVDLADVEGVAHLDAALAALNPRANRMRSAAGTVDAAILTSAAPEPVSADARDSASIQAQLERVPGHHHGENLRTFTVPLDRPVSWPEYAGWLTALRGLPSPDLLRVKGIIRLGESEMPHVIQGVQHVFATPAPIEFMPAEYGNGRLVFITRGIDRDAVVVCLADAAAASGESATTP
jgi:G3E family GTPase